MAVPVHIDDQARDRARQAAIDEWRRRVELNITATPDEHATAIADAVLDTLAERG